MEQDIAIRTITRTAALSMPTVRMAYDQIGVTCRPKRSMLAPVVKGLWQIAGFGQAAGSDELHLAEALS